MKHSQYISAKCEQVLDDCYEELPQRKLPCDQNAGKVHREVSGLSFKEILSAPVKGLESGLLVNAPSISVSSERVNERPYQSPSVFIDSNGPVVDNVSSFSPLRLTGVVIYLLRTRTT